MSVGPNECCARSSSRESHGQSIQSMHLYTATFTIFATLSCSMLSIHCYLCLLYNAVYPLLSLPYYLGYAATSTPTTPTTTATSTAPSTATTTTSTCSSGTTATTTISTTTPTTPTTRTIPACTPPAASGKVEAVLVGLGSYATQRHPQASTSATRPISTEHGQGAWRTWACRGGTMRCNADVVLRNDFARFLLCC